jgi:hypothetical protein
VNSRRFELRHVIVVAAAAALLAPAAAQAATVELQQAIPDHGTSPFETAVYFAEGAHDNRLTIERHAQPAGGPYRGTLDFIDPGETLKVFRGCTLVNPHHARCAPAPGNYIGAVEARLGDGDDKLRNPQVGAAPAIPIGARGGPGDDLLDTGPGPDGLGGGPGHDTLIAGAGNDIVKDPFSEAAGSRHGDLMSGGPGVDTLNYGGRQRAVTVNLSTDAPSGEKGENDKATGFESVQSGRGRDRLYGDSRPNSLRGGSGADVIVGRGGGDSLEGGGGRDRLVAGKGNDEIEPDAARDTVLCGSGRDVVRDPQAGELLGPCESISFGQPSPFAVLPPHPTHTTSRRVDFRIRCSRRQSDGSRADCKGTLGLRTAFGRHRLLGKAHVGHSRRVRVRLNRRGRALIGRRHGVVATASLHARHLPVAAWTVRLRR